MRGIRIQIYRDYLDASWLLKANSCLIWNMINTTTTTTNDNNNINNNNIIIIIFNVN